MYYLVRKLMSLEEMKTGICLLDAIRKMKDRELFAMMFPLMKECLGFDGHLFRIRFYWRGPRLFWIIAEDRVLLSFSLFDRNNLNVKSLVLDKLRGKRDVFTCLSMVGRLWSDSHFGVGYLVLSGLVILKNLTKFAAVVESKSFVHQI